MSWGLSWGLEPEPGPVRAVALFGGTFDPPHRGHVAVARAAADRFALDRVLFAPVGRQPLKQQPAASFVDRLRMVELACAADARFHASSVDAPRVDGEPNYTVDTLSQLERWAREREMVPTEPAEESASLRLYAIAGADSFRTLGQWREPHRLLQLAEWIVVSRPGFPLDVDMAPDGMTLSGTERGRIHALGTVHDPVSATELRQRLEAGEACADLLPAEVAAYIAERGLYRSL